MQGLVTVFGGTGFVGRHVVRALAKDGWRIRVAARRPLRAPELRVMGEVGQIELVRCDLRRRGEVERALDGAHAAVNLVAVLFEQGGQTFDALQVEGARFVAEAAAAHGLSRLTHVSAIGADAAAPSRYGRAKAAGEAAVRDAFPAATILRPSIVFGPEDSFFNRFAAMAALFPVLPLVGAETRFQPVYAGDVAAATATSLRPDFAPGGVFELGGPAVRTFRELMQLMLRDIHRRRVILPLPGPVAALMGSIGDAQSLLLPLAPIITSDQVRSLSVDNVVSPGAKGLDALGIVPTALEGVLPSYLWRFRPDGQFSNAEADGPQGGQPAKEAAFGGSGGFTPLGQ